MRRSFSRATALAADRAEKNKNSASISPVRSWNNTAPNRAVSPSDAGCVQPIMVW